MSLNIFGGASADDLQDFAPPPQTDRFDQAAHLGEVLIVDVHGPKTVSGKFGESTVVVADVVVVGDEPLTFAAAWLKGQAVVDKLSALAGTKQVVKIVKRPSKTAGRSDYYDLEAPDATEAAAARKVYAAMVAAK